MSPLLESTPMPLGPFRLHDVAATFSPLYPAVPVPMTVLMIDAVLTYLTIALAATNFNIKIFYF